MPQMAPMNWLTLFIMFIMFFTMFNSLNYFSFLKSELKQEMLFQKKNKSLNWKW